MARYRRLLAAMLTVFGFAAQACIWDTTALEDEKARHPELADVVLGKSSKTNSSAELRHRLASLEANRREDDPDWWNDLAGAHLRLGKLQAAVEMLEPAVKRFPDNYGVHANLGTAYHLLGRYVEAEREI